MELSGMTEQQIDKAIKRDSRIMLGVVILYVMLFVTSVGYLIAHRDQIDWSTDYYRYHYQYPYEVSRIETGGHMIMVFMSDGTMEVRNQ